MKNPFNLENDKLIDLLNTLDRWFNVPKNKQDCLYNKKT